MTKFLNAAEVVFGQHGYEGTTIRAIATKARVNLGTLKHYWGSKRALFRSLFELRLRPLQQEHARRLATIESGMRPGERPDATQILAALIEPSFFVGLSKDTQLKFQSTRERKRFHLLYGRALMDPSPVVISELNTLFEDSVQTLIRLMRTARPDLSAAEFDWRLNCILGAQVFSQVYGERIGRFIGTEADVDEATASQWVLHFLRCGMDGPPSGTRV